MIVLAFDYESELHAAITESIVVDFGSAAEWVLLHTTLDNITAKDLILINEPVYEGVFTFADEKVVYELKVKKDKVIPLSIDRMHRFILKAKSEIIVFLERCYESYLE